jgi:hypothetical protein
MSAAANVFLFARKVKSHTSSLQHIIIFERAEESIEKKVAAARGQKAPAVCVLILVQSNIIILVHGKTRRGRGEQATQYC